jgi:hypothetical protein
VFLVEISRPGFGSSCLGWRIFFLRPRRGRNRTGVLGGRRVRKVGDSGRRFVLPHEVIVERIGGGDGSRS